MAGYLDTGRLFGSGSTASTLVFGSLMAAKDYAERERQSEAEARQDAYQDDYAEALRNRIAGTFDSKANVDDLCKVLDTTNNPLKRIVNEVSVLYTKRPSRKLNGAPGSTALYRQILKRAGDGVVMPRLNRMCNLHNTVLLYVRPAYDSLTLRLILPQDATVWPDPDDPTMPLCVEFRECDPAAPNAKPVYHQFDRRPESAGYRKYDEHGKQIGATLPPQYFDGDRPLIPIVAFHREFPDYSFWDSTSGDDLYELTIMVGMWETWINHLIRTDSFRQKYATGEVDVSVPQEGGPNAMLSVRPLQGGSVNVGEFSSQADWNGLGAQIKRKLENVLNNVGLVLPDTRTSGDPTSGFALVVRSQGLIKIQKAQIPSYERSEESLYRVVSAVWNFEKDNAAFPKIEGEALPDFAAADPVIAYADVESMQTVEERNAAMDLAEKEIRMGVSSPITVYVGLHPEATEEEARAAIEKNKGDADEGGDEVDPMTALNGAQVTSLIEVVKSVATKQIPRETGIEMIVASFPLDRETASRLMGETGATFFAEAPARPGQPSSAPPFGGDEPTEEDEAEMDAPPRK